MGLRSFGSQEDVESGSRDVGPLGVKVSEDSVRGWFEETTLRRWFEVGVSWVLQRNILRLY